MYLKKFIPKFPKLVYVIILSAFFKSIAYWILTPYLPMYFGDVMNISVEKSGYLIGVGTLAGTIISIFCGFLIDKYNKKSIFLSSLLIMALSYILLPNVSKIIFILILLILANISYSAMSIVSNAWFSINLSEDESTKAFSIKYILENIGAMIGPILGTILVSYNLKFPFFVASFSVFITAIIFFYFTKELPSVKAEIFENVEIAEDKGFMTTFHILFKDKSLLYFTIGGIFSMSVYGALATFLSLYFTKILPYDIAYQRVAYISMLNAIVVLTFQYFVSSIIKKDKIMFWIRISISLMIVGLIILMFDSNIIFLTISIIFLSFGEIAIVPAEYLFIIKITPEESRGAYFGAQNLIFIGLSLSAILCGFLLENFAPSVMFIVLSIILILSYLFYHLGYLKSEDKV